LSGSYPGQVAKARGLRSGAGRSSPVCARKFPGRSPETAVRSSPFRGTHPAKPCSGVPGRGTKAGVCRPESPRNIPWESAFAFPFPGCAFGEKAFRRCLSGIRPKPPRKLKRRRTGHALTKPPPYADNAGTKLLAIVRIVTVAAFSYACLVILIHRDQSCTERHLAIHNSRNCPATVRPGRR